MAARITKGASLSLRLCWQKPHQAASVFVALPAAGEGGPAGKSFGELTGFADGAPKQPMRPVDKSFKLHVGGLISLPTKTMDRPKYDQLAAEDAPPQASVRDPFEGLPFRNFAERWGERIMPVVEHARDTQRGMDRSSLAAAAVAVPQAPHVPHILPFTRWAASSEALQRTLVAEAPKDRKKARLSWYHPDDSMVPRDWFKGGLLADLAYYRPFAA